MKISSLAAIIITLLTLLLGVATGCTNTCGADQVSCSPPFLSSQPSPELVAGKMISPVVHAG